MNEVLPPSPAPPSVPPKAAAQQPSRAGWRDAIFNYGTLVAVVLGVLGVLFMQLSDVRVKLAEQHGSVLTKLAAHDERFDRIDKQFDEVNRRLGKLEANNERILEILTDVRTSIARIEERGKKP